MISEQLFALFEDFSDDPVRNVKSFNDLIIQAETTEDVELESNVFHFFKIISENIIKKMAESDFIWQRKEASELQFFFRQFIKLKSSLFREFANCRFFNKLFEIRFVDIFCRYSIDALNGNFAYDDVLRATSYIMMFFINVFLLKELAFKPSMKSKNLHLYDPFFREKVRSKNRDDQGIKDRFFNDNFNLKNFLLLCLENYFPNVAYRWLGGKQYMHYLTLKMICLLFDYGLWEHEELQELLIKIYSISQILQRLEISIQRDCEAHRFNIILINDWRDTSLKCRKKVGSILIHIILMNVDRELTLFLPKIDMPICPAFGDYPTIVSANKSSIDSIFEFEKFENKWLNIYVLNILTNYLIKPVYYNSEECTVYSKSLEKIIALLFSNANEIRSSFINVSLNTLQSEVLPFYLFSDDAPIFMLVGRFHSRFESIVGKVEGSLITDPKSENSDFSIEFSAALQEIIDLFRSFGTDDNVISVHQCAFLLANIPQFILAILHFCFSTEASTEANSKILSLGFNALTALCQGNNQCINSVFSSYNFGHLSALLKQNACYSISFIIRIFTKDSNFYVLEQNPELVDLFITHFKLLLEETIPSLLLWLDDGQVNLNVHDVIGILIFIELFKKMIKTNFRLKFNFQFLIRDALIENSVIPVLQALRDKRMRVCALLTDQTFKSSKLDDLLNLATNTNTPALAEQISLVSKTIYSILKLFNRTVKHLYDAQTHTVLSKFFAENSLKTFTPFLETSRGMKIFKEVIILFTSIMILEQNHLLDRKTLKIKKKDSNIEEYIRKGQMAPFVYQELIDVIGPMKKAVTSTILLDDQKINFVFSAILPPIFKLYAGLLRHLTSAQLNQLNKEEFEVFANYVKVFLDFADGFQFLNSDEILTDPDAKADNLIKHLERLQSYHNSVDSNDAASNGQTETFWSQANKLLDCLFQIYRRYHTNKIHYISDYVDIVDGALERSIENTVSFRFDFWLKFRNGVKKINSICEDYLNSLPKTNKRVDSDFNYETETEANGSNPRSKTMFKENAEGGTKSSDFVSSAPNNNIIVQQPNQTANKVLAQMKDRYLFLKQYFFDKKNNIVVSVFCTNDLIRKNVQFMIDYFVFVLKRDTFDSKFFANDHLINLVVYFYNLINISKLYKEKFYDTINNEQNAEAMKRIWKLHKRLLYYCLYSTFVDQTWIQIYCLYNLLSYFIQELCENNFTPFKKYFAQVSFSNTSKAVLEYYYLIIESTLKNTELHRYENQKLGLRDQSERFLVYSRFVEGFTEFTNSGKTLGQGVVYQKRIDIWIGILLRIIDDVDSVFYSVKYNILLYLSAIVEDSEKSTFQNIAAHLSVTNFFYLITTLFKKLYARQILLNNQRGRFSKNARSKNAIRVITDEDVENTVFNISYSRLIEFYKSYQSTFSEHVIMDILIRLYSFLNIMSLQITSYQIFLKETSSTVRSSIFSVSNPKNDAYDTDSVNILSFIKSLILEIEIQYADSQKEQNESQLILHYFKKIPLCFYWTDDMETEFKSQADISSLDMKHDSFFDKLKYHTTILRDSRNIYQKSKWLFFIYQDKAFELYLLLLYQIAIVINVLLIVMNNFSGGTILNSVYSNFDIAIIVLALSNSTLSVLLMLFWLFLKYPTIKKLEWEEFFIKNNHIERPSWTSILKISFGNSLLAQKVFRTLILHALFSLLGLFVAPFFYSLLLLLIVDLSFLMYSVVKSFINNYDKLAYTFLMIILIINFFAYLAANYFTTSFNVGDDSDSFCSTYFRCFINSINQGLRSGGGLADKMNSSTDIRVSTFSARFFFDIMFFILVDIILLGMFFGIIVDSFKEYRNELDVRREDQQNICFTCGLTREDLKAYSIDFGQHKKYHDIWKYLFYIVYLESKPLNAYERIDLFVHDKIEGNQRREWLPIGRTLLMNKRNK